MNAGENTITRSSTDSSVTIPFEQTFRDLSPQGSDPRRTSLAEFNFCGCGWPQHMLVPKGTEAGAAYQLFVMLSNYDLDSVSTSLLLVYQATYTLYSCPNNSRYRESIVHNAISCLTGGPT